KAINEKLIYQTITGREELLPNASTSAQNWKYTTLKPPYDWINADFKDTAWNIGKAGFGSGTPPNSFINTEWNTSDIWLRKDFKLGKVIPADLDNLSFQIYYDEDYEIYINGILVMSAKGHSSNYVTIPLNVVAQKALKPNGVNTIAVHCRQTSGGQFIDVGLFKVNYSPDSRWFTK
ncbi:MAG: glycoside hydrolase family 2, partial [Pyrinomonadaceae bacterium]|nr:glycoside hydrolase family 2 [Sphingobacteriaceae bacterium]